MLNKLIKKSSKKLVLFIFTIFKIFYWTSHKLIMIFIKEFLLKIRPNSKHSTYK